MKKSVIIFLLLMLVLVVSGCTTDNLSASTSLKDILANTSKYNNTNVTVSGHITYYPSGSIFNFKLTDSDGYSILLSVSKNRNFERDEIYTIKGTLVWFPGKWIVAYWAPEPAWYLSVID